MISLLAILAFTLFSSVALAAPALVATPTGPPKGACTIHSVEVDTEGNGCRDGTVGVAVSEDNSLMTFIFDNFQAAIGPKANGMGKRALCKVFVSMSAPGWAFQVASVDFRGYVQLERGVDASIVSRWKWIDSDGEDMKGKGNMQRRVEGPLIEDFLLHKDGEVSDKDPSVCAKANAKFQLTLSATLSASDSTAGGMIQGGSLDSKFSEILGLSWKKC